MKKTIVTFLSLGLLVSQPSAFSAPDPIKLVEQMDQVIRGNSHDMTVTLDVKTKRWQRTYKIHVLMKGVDFAFARVLEPPKTAGQGFLRVKARLWQYLPTAERTILIPPSLMLDDFMGSDFSNDDFVKLSYFPRDYTSKILKEEKMDGFKTYHLELLPKPDAPVTYGKLELWLRKEDSAPLQWDFYNEKMEPIRTLHYSDFKKFGTHEVPTVWDMKNLKDKDRHTTIKILDAQYDVEISDSIFNRKQLEQYP
ncbi:MAG: outer membrane lipoprotein-sorting protein [Candidatus Omnitrophica bacterium]|nr:outer membrane lipoprotein-sorting protein [Candidatus Omnitrophota bacterium]